MKTKWYPKIGIEEKHLPYKWMENLVKDGKVGGVLLVFVEGRDRKEVTWKVNKIKSFCKDLRKTDWVGEMTLGGDPNNPFPLSYLDASPIKQGDVQSVSRLVKGKWRRVSNIGFVRNMEEEEKLEAKRELKRIIKRGNRQEIRGAMRSFWLLIDRIVPVQEELIETAKKIFKNETGGGIGSGQRNGLTVRLLLMKSKKHKATIWLEEKQYQQLRTLSFTSLKSQSKLVEEALELLFKMPKGGKGI